MKKSYIRNPQAQISDDESSFVEEVAEPVRFDALKIILILFIVLPVIYVLVIQTPGSWLPADLPEIPVTSKEKPEPAVNAFVSLDSAIIKASNNPSFENYFQLSFKFYQAKKFKESITAAEKALEFKPRSAEAYNNICSAYNELKEYSKAKEACESALDIDPGFQLAKNNLAWSLKNLEK